MEENAEKMAEFLTALTAVSRKTGIAIAGSPTLFLMLAEDVARNYQIDGESNLSFS